MKRDRGTTKDRCSVFGRILLLICTAALVAILGAGCQTPTPGDDGWYITSLEDGSWARWRFSETTNNAGETVQFIEDETHTVAIATLDDAVALFRDFSSYAETFGNAEALLIETLGEDMWLVYEFIDNPWPIADSDRVCEITYQHDEEGVAVFSFHARPDAYADQGAARQERYDVSYTFTDLGDGRIEMHERGKAIPPVDVPEWLLNSAFPDALFDSLLHIRDTLEQG